MIQEAIVARLAAVSGLTALIGTQPTMRCYPRLAPQRPTYPIVVYTRSEPEERERAMGSDPGLVHSHWAFVVVDSNVTMVRNVAEQLRLALERWRTTSNGTTVQDTFITGIDEAAPVLVDSVPIFMTDVDVEIHYTE